MRIWIINHYALPPTSAGGTRHYNFARQLIKRGHEVTLIASNYNHFSHTYISENNFDVPFIWVPSPAYSGNTVARFWNMLVFSFNILLKKHLPNGKPDVIIGSSPHLFSAYSAEKLAKRFNVPFVLEIRDIWPDTLVDIGRISAKHPLICLMKYVELHLYRCADRVITLLPAADKYLVSAGVDQNKIVWLPNNVDPDNIPTNEKRESNTKFTIMYVGAHGLANDLDTVLDAAKLLQAQSLDQKITICLVGDGPDKQRLQDRVTTEKITMVEIIASVPKNQIYHLMLQADVFLMLLKDSPVFRWGISPNKLFDYLLMQRPVIFGVDTPINPVDKCKAGLTIKPSNPEALAAAIIKMSSLPKQELNAMGERGREYVLQHHHISVLTDALERMLEEVIVEHTEVCATTAR
jgi:glycosyltransferase involved in cell wall biosynthesis